jgi:GntR family histidine utilization transcriptional repressor
VLLLEETQADLIQAAALNVAEGTRIFHSLMVHFENEVRYRLKTAASMRRWCRTI